ncbi:LysM peptidoglycan-binding domain-containing protein [Aspergillus saccharolyticus JOP 1030-1]|uniref:LysM domain-containing protein n=1 Tax=Aspergillus saccharolyticus JOP 1030-1 TaxID=1450539 RepID=A0A318ZXT1_9EURO|nr:hypothetical protein BP01DRAFT_378021 [Aspergillus saccharolyticus JOP 1030-1]PYH40212.1 hypothetical protein BP01DRAFT_378021 [Aspergillus saccharolyticus JOP 1030-1]
MERTSTALSSCDHSSLNTTVGSYYVKENQTIAEISRQVDRGICDIARINRMADAMIPLYTGEELIIPPEICKPNNSTCLIVEKPGAVYADCIKGGPHTYYTLKGDKFRYIKLNLTLAALESTAQIEVSDPDAEVEADNFIKLPQCDPNSLGTTVGQMMAINPTYNHSEGGKGEGAVISMLYDCEYTGSNVTVVS